MDSVYVLTFYRKVCNACKRLYFAEKYKFANKKSNFPNTP
ncbi:hypothetical protein LEP1GSC043_3708 [Leptospira weilii str. Ecochallenge]|uniref:Uncharacterized protein n=1 Tax=Leptospira weilii str. Ecochallenge TaxID=1049986 RepID=N1U7Z8_9LEPT|nr:hypothetical protein LEP1GSC043_3708 [Leptospira weilii str. Ecochallenge]